MHVSPVLLNALQWFQVLLSELVVLQILGCISASTIDLLGPDQRWQNQQF